MKATHLRAKPYLLLTCILLAVVALRSFQPAAGSPPNNRDKKQTAGAATIKSAAATRTTPEINAAADKNSPAEGEAAVVVAGPKDSRVQPGPVTPAERKDENKSQDANNLISPAAGNASAPGNSQRINNSAVDKDSAISTGTKDAPAASSGSLPLKRRKLGLGPGQKYKITGFADGQSTSIVDDSSDGKPAAYHRAQMRLTGSMCFSCLQEVQEKLKQVFGVERARITKAEQVSIQSYAPAVDNWADAIFIYDANKLDLVDLRAYIRANSYYPYKVQDKEVDSVPPEDHKKL